MSRHIAEQFTMPILDGTVKFDYGKLPGRAVQHIRFLTRRRALCGWRGRQYKTVDYQTKPHEFPMCLVCAAIAEKKAIQFEK